MMNGKSFLKRYNIGGLRPFSDRNPEIRPKCSKNQFPLKVSVSGRNAEKPLKQVGTQPPKAGECKVCKREIPVNSKHVCYECFVKTNLRNAGWTRFDIHPESCQCVLKVTHMGRKSDGN